MKLKESGINLLIRLLELKGQTLHLYRARGLIVFRVVTDIRDYRGNRLLEAGPWHKAENIAEEWAEILRGLGYTVKIERMKGEIAGGSGGNDELMDALASMA